MVQRREITVRPVARQRSEAEDSDQLNVEYQVQQGCDIHLLLLSMDSEVKQPTDSEKCWQIFPKQAAQ
jgi:hypothetical protein